MLKRILSFLVLVIFVIAVPQVQADHNHYNGCGHQNYGGGYYPPVVSHAEAHATLTCLVNPARCPYQSYGFGSRYGYDYEFDRGYGRGRGISIREAVILGGAVAGGVAIHRHIQGKNERKSLADDCVAGDDIACNQLRYRSEKDWQKAMQARGQSRLPLRSERYEQEEAVPSVPEDNESSELTLDVINKTGADVRFIVWRSDQREVHNLRPNQTLKIAAGDRYKAVINYKGRKHQADVVFHPDRDRTLVLMAPAL